MAKWVDRTGEVYGALRVIRPIRQAGMWLCECTNCGAELKRTPVALRNARRQGTTQCEQCQDLAALGRAGRQAQQETVSISFDYSSPMGLLAQRIICRGLRA